MSISVISPETSPEHPEVVIDSFRELLMVKDALGDYIVIHKDSQNSSEYRLEQAHVLREQMVDDVTETLSGEVTGKYRYAVDEPKLVYDALQAAKQRDEQLERAQKVHYPEYAWLYDRTNTHPANTHPDPVYSKLFRD